LIDTGQKYHVELKVFMDQQLKWIVYTDRSGLKSIYWPWLANIVNGRRSSSKTDLKPKIISNFIQTS